MRVLETYQIVRATTKLEGIMGIPFDGGHPVLRASVRQVPLAGVAPLTELNSEFGWMCWRRLRSNREVLVPVLKTSRYHS